MGKHKFDRKKAVRFTLVPGPEKDGKPSVLFQPVQIKKSKLSKKERKQVISKLSDIDQVTINGKVIDEDQIPAYVLDQIKGRGDLVYNQIHPEEEEQGDLYQLQDAPGIEENEYQEYEDYDFEAEGIEEENLDQQQWEDDEDQQEVQIKQSQKAVKLNLKVEEFPCLQELQTVVIQGKQFKMTKKQMQMLDTLIPENYQQMEFGGLKFKKYNEDGLLYSEKEKYEKYFLKQDEKPVIIDTFEYVPLKPRDFIDNDLNENQIKGNKNIKEVQDALNYEGEDEIYDELQDDFFSKMIQQETSAAVEKNESKSTKRNKKQETQNKKKQNYHRIQQTVKAHISQKELEQRLEKAMFNFENNIQEKKQNKNISEESDSEQEENGVKNSSTPINFRELEKKQEYIGKDGEMDWRFLTKQQKKAYMKTKVIRQFYDQLREREVQQKMRGKNNVQVSELHLKQRIEHIPFSEDHVMQKALEDDLNQQEAIDEDFIDDYSDQDDIISFHQKTSIIATNLSVIEEPKKEKKKKEKEDPIEEANISKVKVVPDRRNRNQTSQERKERKQKLKEMKKEKREQKKEFAERFSKIKKQTMKKENNTNPLNKVSYVKIY